MRMSEKEDYATNDEVLASTFKALGHPARMAIVKVLLERKKCICGSIVNEIPLSQSTISQHLKVLKNAGLIKGEVEGATVCYCINQEKWNLINKDILSFFNQIIDNNSNCC